MVHIYNWLFSFNFLTTYGMVLFRYLSVVHLMLRNLCPWRVFRWCTSRIVGGSMCLWASERNRLRPKRRVRSSRRASSVVQLNTFIAFS